MEEKRKFKRIEFKEAIQYNIDSGIALGDLQYNIDWHGPQHQMWSTFGGCLAYDLSEGGVRFRSNDFIPLNTEMSLKFQLESDSQVDLKAKVVWVRQIPHSEIFQVGLKFEDSHLNALVKEGLHEFVESRRF